MRRPFCNESFVSGAVGGVSPRAIPGTEGYAHVVATDEHDQDGVLISDEFTNPLKRRAMHEKRMRKMDGVLPLIQPPEVFGPWIESRFVKSGLRPEPGVGDAIVELAGNLPYDVQRLAHEVWDDVRSDRRKTADLDDLHGTADQTIGYDGGTIPFGRPYPSAPATVAKWAERNGCNAPW